MHPLCQLTFDVDRKHKVCQIWDKVDDLRLLELVKVQCFQAHNVLILNHPLWYSVANIQDECRCSEVGQLEEQEQNIDSHDQGAVEYHNVPETLSDIDIIGTNFHIDQNGYDEKKAPVYEVSWIKLYQEIENCKYQNHYNVPFEIVNKLEYSVDGGVSGFEISFGRAAASFNFFGVVEKALDKVLEIANQKHCPLLILERISKKLLSRLNLIP